MAKPAATPATPANPIVVSLAADAQPLDSVVTMLDSACVASVTMNTQARNAAVAACAGNFLDLTPEDRTAKILALYMAHLTEKAVKEVFSAAVATLAADKPVRVSATEKGEKAPNKDYPTGMLTFKAPEVLTPVAEKGEIIPEGRIVAELTPAEAVEKLTGELLKKVGTAARAAMGTGRASGGGRKAEKAERAPFMAEFAAAWADDALRLQITQMIRASGWDVVRAKEPRVMSKQADAPTLAAQATA